MGSFHWVPHISSSWAWLSNLGPILLGIFGGVGAVFLWEGVLKPGRERRDLAYIFGAEITHNAKLAFMERLHMEQVPENVASDFRLSTAVFDASVGKIGGLRRLTGEIVLFYESVRTLMRTFDYYEDTAKRFREAKLRASPITPQTPAAVLREKDAAEAQLKITRRVILEGLLSLTSRANSLVPQLRKSSYSPWRQVRRRAALRQPVFDEVAARAKSAVALQAFQSRMESGSPSPR